MVYSLWAVNTLASVPVKQFVVQQLLRGLVRRLCQVVHLPCVTNASESRYVMTSCNIKHASKHSCQQK